MKSILVAVALFVGAAPASAALEAQIQLGPVLFDPATGAGVERGLELPLPFASVELDTPSSALRLEAIDDARTRLILGHGESGPVSGRITWDDDGVRRSALVAGEVVTAARDAWPALLFRDRDLAARHRQSIRMIGLGAARSVHTSQGSLGMAAPDARGWQHVPTIARDAESRARLVLDDGHGELRAQFSTLEAISVLSKIGLQADLDWVQVRALRERLQGGNLQARILARARKRDARFVRAFDFTQDGAQGRFQRVNTIALPRRGSQARMLGLRIDKPGTTAQRARALLLAGQRARLLDPRNGVVDRATREGTWFAGAAARSRLVERRAFAVRRRAQTQDFHVHGWNVLGDTDGTRLVGKRFRPSLSDRLGVRVQRVFDALVTVDRTGWPQQALRERLLVLGRSNDLPSVWAVRLDPARERVMSVRTRWTGQRLGDLGLGRPRFHRVASPLAGQGGFPRRLRVQLPAVQATRMLERASSGARFVPVRETPTLSFGADVDGFGLARPRFLQLDRNANQQVVLVRYAVTPNGLEPLTGRRLVGETEPIALRASRRLRGAYGLTGKTGERFLRAFDLDLGSTGLPPRIDAGADVAIRATNETGARVRLFARTNDANGDPLALRWSAPGVRFDDPSSPQTEAWFPVGTTDVVARVRERRLNGMHKGSIVYEATDLLRVTVAAPTATPSVGLRTAIAGAFPNPFNPRTRIAFSLERGGFVELDVFDARGRRVRSLLGEHRTAGPWDVVWDGLDDDGRSVASGVYHVQLTAGDTVDTARLTLVR